MHLLKKAKPVRDAAGSGVGAGDDHHTQLVRADERFAMSIDDALEVADDCFVPSQICRAVNLKLDWRERRHPCDVSIAHLPELILGDEKAMLDGVDAAF